MEERERERERTEKKQIHANHTRECWKSRAFVWHDHSTVGVGRVSLPQYFNPIFTFYAPSFSCHLAALQHTATVFFCFFFLHMLQ